MNVITSGCCAGLKICVLRVQSSERKMPGNKMSGIGKAGTRRKGRLFKACQSSLEKKKKKKIKKRRRRRRMRRMKRMRRREKRKEKKERKKKRSSRV